MNEPTELEFEGMPIALTMFTLTSAKDMAYDGTLSPEQAVKFTGTGVVKEIRNGRGPSGAWRRIHVIEAEAVEIIYSAPRPQDAANTP